MYNNCSLRSNRKVRDWNRWGRAGAQAPEIDRRMLSCIPIILWGEEDPPAHPLRRRRRAIRTYKITHVELFYLPPCQLEEIWGTPWGNLNSYFWESRAVSQCSGWWWWRVEGLGYPPLMPNMRSYMLKAMYVNRVDFESFSWIQGMRWFGSGVSDAHVSPGTICDSTKFD